MRMALPRNHEAFIQLCMQSLCPDPLAPPSLTHGPMQNEAAGSRRKKRSMFIDDIADVDDDDDEEEPDVSELGSAAGIFISQAA